MNVGQKAAERGALGGKGLSGEGGKILYLTSLWIKSMFSMCIYVNVCSLCANITVRLIFFFTQN